MIEVQFNVEAIRALAKQNEVLSQIAMIEALQSIGVPLEGPLILRGVTDGTLAIHQEEDIDGDLVNVMRWIHKEKSPIVPTGTRSRQLRAGKGSFYTWREIVPHGWVAPTTDDDEI